MIVCLPQSTVHLSLGSNTCHSKQHPLNYRGLSAVMKQKQMSFLKSHYLPQKGRLTVETRMVIVHFNSEDGYFNMGMSKN